MAFYYLLGLLFKQEEIKMNKRYLLFGFDCYYPCGGMDDFIDSFDTLEEIEQWYIQHPNHSDGYNIFDRVESKIIDL